MEWKYMRGTGIALVAALALGLAGCGSSGDDDTADAPAVSGPTQAELDAAQAAADAAQKAADEAAAQAAAEQAAKEEAEAALAAEQAKQLRTMSKQLESAINSGPLNTATPPVEQSPLDKFATIAAVGGPPSLPAVPSLTGAGLTLGLAGATTDAADDVRTPRMATGDSVGSLGSWAGTMYSHKSADSGASNEAVVYINRADTPGKTFVEGVRPPTGATLTAATRTVTFDAAGLGATRDVTGDGFPSAGTTSYTVNPVTQSVVIEGAYQGAPGQYSCDDTCSATASSAGVALVGQWKFVADAGSMTARVDTNYLWFGWWIAKDKSGAPTNAGVFTGVNAPTTGATAIQGTAATALATNPTALGGSATYSGAAAGKFAIDDPLGDAGAGHFTADVALKASFGQASTAGVTGTIDGFTLNDDHDVDWSVRLRRAAWNTTTAGAFAMGTNGTMWSIDGNTAPSTSGSWRGQMYDEKPGGPPAGDDSNVPTSATGVFHSQFGGTHSMVGAFGVARD